MLVVCGFEIRNRRGGCEFDTEEEEEEEGEGCGEFGIMGFWRA